VTPEEEISLLGPAGKLEAIQVAPAEHSTTIVIICHPHPLYGGTMNNKVVTTLARTFYEMNLWTLRFNFRGIGKSEGGYGEAVGEIEDLQAVLVWVKKQFPEYQIWLAGFSFGAYIAAQVAAKDQDIRQLISIAPPVNHFNFQDTQTVSCPWLLIMGEEDEVVPVDEVKAWLKASKIPIQSIFLPNTTHFFHGKLIELKMALKSGLNAPF